MKSTYILKNNSTFKDLVQELDQCGEGFLSVVDLDQKLIGIVTDGDIRRAILNNVKDLNKIINKSPIKGEVGISREKALMLLKQNHRRHLPIINKSGRLLNVIKLDNWSEIYRPNKVVIMAGGLGSRLGNLTKSTPKPMLSIGDQPILENLIRSFQESGFYNFLICVNYKSEVIKKYFGDGTALGVSIQYIEEEKRMGTAGALSLISIPINEPFFVVNGDILSSINFEKMLAEHLESNACATMAVAKRSDKIQYGVVNFDAGQRIESIIEKPNREYFINGGAYVLNPHIFKEIPHNQFFDMPNLFGKLIKMKQVTSAYIIEGFWLDIGLRSDYNKANSLLSNYNGTTD
ncbi:nucleotidyltransferase family protein [Vicingaceae bacterium]|nr:nucleotidyltransferase family protein [Vicingaceae bacterium]